MRKILATLALAGALIAGATPAGAAAAKTYAVKVTVSHFRLAGGGPAATVTFTVGGTTRSCLAGNYRVDDRGPGGSAESFHCGNGGYFLSSTHGVATIHVAHGRYVYRCADGGGLPKVVTCHATRAAR